jgi:hypothetical protein
LAAFRTVTSASRSNQETTDRTTTRNPVFFLFKSTWSLPHLGETPNRSHQEATTSAKLTGAKLAAFPNCYQCKQLTAYQPTAKALYFFFSKAQSNCKPFPNPMFYNTLPFHTNIEACII